MNQLDTTDLMKFCGTYLPFRVGEEEYLIDVLNVNEVIDYSEIIPYSVICEYIDGVIEYRNSTLPVILLSGLFGVADNTMAETTSIIVVHTIGADESERFGLVVDSLSAMVDVEIDDLEEKPAFSILHDDRFVVCLANVREKARKIIDPSALPVSHDLSLLA